MAHFPKRSPGPRGSRCVMGQRPELTQLQSPFSCLALSRLFKRHQAAASDTYLHRTGFVKYTARDVAVQPVLKLVCLSSLNQ